jgi:hypothetical protein
MTQPESSRSAPDGRRLTVSSDGSAAGDLPVAQRVARLLRDLQEARTRRGQRQGEDAALLRTDAEPPLVRLLPPERTLREVAREREAWEEVPGPAEEGVQNTTGRRSRNGAEGEFRGSQGSGSRRPPARAGRRARAAERERQSPAIQPRTERPEIPEGSRLSAAEIQALIRAGRGVRTVAEIAEAPVDWVRYLAEPVFAERAAVLSQILTARPRRPRAKGPGDPLGRALLLALRARKIPGPEHVLATGFTAYRRGHEPWRVRLTFRQDGRRLSALWAYDPRTHSVEPRNSLADELGWRRVSPGR